MISSCRALRVTARALAPRALALVGCLLGSGILPPEAAAQQTVLPSPADTTQGVIEVPVEGWPEPVDRPSFQLPEVIVTGEDLSRITGGTPMEAGQPRLQLTPLERPGRAPAPRLGSPWRTGRPFQLMPGEPPVVVSVPAWARVGIGTEPGILGAWRVGRARSRTAWRLSGDGEWAEGPVRRTERRALAVSFQTAQGAWMDEPHWSAGGDAAVSSLDWDLAGLPVSGPREFAGLRGRFWRWWRGARAGLGIEGGRSIGYDGAGTTRWTGANLTFDLGAARDHPLLWDPDVSVRVSGWTGRQPGDGSIQRTEGRVRGGWSALRRGTAFLWLGAQGAWDEGRGVAAPRLLARWGDPQRGMILWTEAAADMRIDPWWDEGKDADYALLDLDRPSTASAPFLTGGVETVRAGWRIAAKGSWRRERSPRDWIRMDGVGLFRPVSGSNRWIQELSVRIQSPDSEPVRLELESGFLEDRGDPDLAFRPGVWANASVKGRAGPYTGGLWVDLRGRAPDGLGGRLDPFFTADAEVGRHVGRSGRLWLRVDNATGDPARLWPFVPSSKRALVVGYDFRPTWPVGR